MKYENIIFDLDNTILDFDYAEEKALEKLLEENNISYNEDTLKIYKEVNHVLWRKLEKKEITRDELFTIRFPLFFDKIGRKPEAKEYDIIYKSYLAHFGINEIQNSLEIIKTLKGKGCKIYIATNGYSKTQRSRILNSGLSKIVDDVFISEEIGYDKPDKNFFEYIFNKLNMDTDKTIMIGDSESSDIIGAKNANIDSILFVKNPNEEKKDTTAKYVIEKLDDIFKIIE